MTARGMPGSLPAGGPVRRCHAGGLGTRGPVMAPVGDWVPLYRGSHVMRGRSAPGYGQGRTRPLGVFTVLAGADYALVSISRRYPGGPGPAHAAAPSARRVPSAPEPELTGPDPAPPGPQSDPGVREGGDGSGWPRQWMWCAARAHLLKGPSTQSGRALQHRGRRSAPTGPQAHPLPSRQSSRATRRSDRQRHRDAWDRGHPGLAHS